MPDPKEKAAEAAKNTITDIGVLAKNEAEGWWKDVLATGKHSLGELTGDAKEVTLGALKDLAALKIKQSMGQHVGREAALVESTLQDLKAVVAIDGMVAIRDVVMKSAGHATSIIGGIFGRVLRNFGVDLG